MEYTSIQGNSDAIKQAALIPGIKVMGIAKEVSKDLWQLHAFCSEEMIALLKQKGLTVEVIKSNAKVDHKLAALVRETPVAGDQEMLFILVHFNCDLSELQALGFNVDSESGNTAGGTITLGDFKSLINHPGIISIDTPKNRFPALNKSVPDINANQVWSRSGDTFSGFTGKGVIVGIADTGIDFSHKNFIRADGTTRILAIWDQTLGPQAGEIQPDPITNPVIGNATLNYGVLYDDSRKVFGGLGVIQAALNSEHPTVPVRHLDEHGHGTHVAGISAGDGSQKDGCTSSTAYKYIGVAPEADIVMVRVFGSSPGDSKLPPLAGHDPYGDAILFMLDYAFKRKQPIAINISLGSMSEKMDASGYYAVKFDGLLNRNFADVAATPTSKGAAIIIAAGNNGECAFHSSSNVPLRGSANEILKIKFGLRPNDVTERVMKILYSNTNTLACQLTSALDKIAFTSTNTNNVSAKINGPGGQGKIEFAPGEITITITPVAKGTNYSGTEWSLELKDVGAGPPAAIPVNAYIIHCDPNNPTNPYFLDFVITTGTINEDASAKNVITVGAYSVVGLKVPGQQQLAGFSSRGPVIDNPLNANPDRIKPEIAAPGVGIFSAKSDHKLTTGNNCCCDCCYDFYIEQGGTSMAAPHITGVAALMLQKNPKLNYKDLRKKLMDGNAGIPPGATPDEVLGWGKGKVDAKAAVNAVVPMVGVSVVQPAPAAALAPHEEDAWSTLVEKFLRGPRGSELAGLFRLYFQEVRMLINKNKRVATVWHRNKGSLWVRSALYAAQHPDVPIPAEVEGFSLKESLNKMAGIIRKYGSEKLQEAIAKYESEFELLCHGLSLTQLVDEVSDPAHAMA